MIRAVVAAGGRVALAETSLSFFYFFLPNAASTCFLMSP